jgi:hypothetical protein
MEMIEHLGGRAKVVATTKEKVGVVTIKDSRINKAIRVV